MTKNFSLLQLFSIVDGRLSTDMGDIYLMLNHICDTDLMTHHLPVAKDYMKSKNPSWHSKVESVYNLMGATRATDFKECMSIIKNNDEQIEVPQLKDEFDTSDFGQYMVSNSLLRNK